MIDLHMHILPGMDDGAQDLEQSVRMADMAADSGVSVIAATPHSNLPGQRGEAHWNRYRSTLERVRQRIQEEKIPVTLVEGMEIFADLDAVSKLKEGLLLTLGGTKHPLIEFGFDVDIRTAFACLERFLKEGYVPVLAHPERYFCVMDHPELVYEWYRMGVIIQVNKGSILGRFGRRVQQTADRLLRHRLAAVAASDAHGPVIRTPDLTELEYVLDREYGPGCFDLLLEINPARILSGKPVIWEDPIPFHKERRIHS